MGPEAGLPVAEQDNGAAVMREIAHSLHELCQPLTALQCRLEIGQMAGTPEGYQEAVGEALRESERLLEAVGSMRELVRCALQRIEVSGIVQDMIGDGLRLSAG